MRLRLEWDRSKAADDVRKHGVTFREATTALADPLSITVFDPDHSDEEDRFVLIGLSHRGRLLVVVHAARGEVVRLIPARLARRHERQTYEERPP